MIFSLLLSLSFPSVAFASNYATLPGFREISGSRIEVTNVGPVKDQDTIGVCYGFTASTLMEAHYCRMNNVDCTNPANDAVISPLFTASRHSRNSYLREGGDVRSAFYDLQRNRDKYAAKNSCAPFDVLARNGSYMFNGKILNGNAPLVGWSKLRAAYLANRGADPNVTLDCARSIQSFFSPSTTLSLEEIRDALISSRIMDDNDKDDRGSYEFLAKILVPQRCLSPGQALKIPDFEMKQYPERGVGPATREGILGALRKALASGIPVNVNFCDPPVTSSPADGPAVCASEGAHATTVTGYKEVCNGSDCRPAFKIHNSYGMDWQMRNDDGWVDGNWIMDLMIQYNQKDKANVLTWIQKPKETLVAAPASSLGTDSRSRGAPPADSKRDNRPLIGPGPPGSMYKCPPQQNGGAWVYTNEYRPGCQLFRAR